ncbi:MAG: hypothetical protein BMS9Abin07_0716 [Acidimicrobiia bacterium]|nr:MAG: hypothetical protein BMS9Abin07_0716 [Acidimicrobiia bacterium]
MDQWGYETAGVAAVDRRGTRRVLVILVAFLVAAAGLFLTAPPGQAESDPQVGVGTAVVTCGEGSLVTIPITNNSSYNMYISDLNVWDGETLVWDLSEVYEGEGGVLVLAGDTHDVEIWGLDDGGYDFDGNVYWASEASASFEGSFSVDCEGNGEGGFGDPISCTAGGCEEFADPDGNWTATCNGCSGSVILQEPGENVADVEVTGSDPFKLKLTTKKGVGPRARHAKVFKVTDDGEVELPRCTRGRSHKHWQKHWNRRHPGFLWHRHWHRHDRVTTNCVIVKQKHHRIQYIVKFTDDPRFRFR